MKILKPNPDILSSSYHTTVLPTETVAALEPKPDGLYLDATFGGGGHTRLLLHTYPQARVIAFDWDEEAIKRNAPALIEEFGNRLTVVWGNFAHCYRLLKKANIKKLNGVMADFGTSQFQINNEEGFSFTHDTPLDMRMSKAHYYFNAAHIVNKFSPKEIANILFQYGEEGHARKIAAAIEQHRSTVGAITTTKELADIVSKVVPVLGHRRVHPATKTFQALRIFVNKELDNITMFLKAVVPFIEPGGNIACISFHSLEDRLVKTFYREHESLEPVTRKPIIASEEELERNRSARSAKLRVAKKR